MAIGERIRFFRNLCGMTQKYLGQVVGFPEKTADIRMAQYESGSRTPKADLTNNLANVFGISTSALTVPDIDSYNGLMHTLFTLEDLYGFRIDKLDDDKVYKVITNEYIASGKDGYAPFLHGNIVKVSAKSQIKLFCDLLQNLKTITNDNIKF